MDVRDGALGNDFAAETVLGEIETGTLQALASAWREQRVPDGRLIYGTEEEGGDLGFLLSGAARATVYTSRGKQITFLELRPGDCFGEFAAIDGGQRSASVVAWGDCEIARLPRRRFLELLGAHGDLTGAMLRLLVRKLRGMSMRMEELTSLRADQRVRLEIVRLAKRHRIAPDAAEIPAPPTQADLASWVLTNRESVAKEMSRMRAAGLILRRGRAIGVPSISRLETSIG